jgi:hypothetical protein
VEVKMTKEIIWSLFYPEETLILKVRRVLSLRTGNARGIHLVSGKKIFSRKTGRSKKWDFS